MEVSVFCRKNSRSIQTALADRLLARAFSHMETHCTCSLQVSSTSLCRQFRAVACNWEAWAGPLATSCRWNRLWLWRFRDSLGRRSVAWHAPVPTARTRRKGKWSPLLCSDEGEPLWHGTAQRASILLPRQAWGDGKEKAHLSHSRLREDLPQDLAAAGPCTPAHRRAAFRLQLGILRQEVHTQRWAPATRPDAHRCVWGPGMLLTHIITEHAT